MASDIAQVEELAKEWALEGIKSGLGDDVKGVWWVVANLVSVEMISVEDVIETIVQLVTNPSTGKELSEGQSLELLSQVYGLLCAESGTKLNLSLAVRPISAFCLFRTSFLYDLFDIGSHRTKPACRIWRSYSASS